MGKGEERGKDEQATGKPNRQDKKLTDLTTTRRTKTRRAAAAPRARAVGKALADPSPLSTTSYEWSIQSALEGDPNGEGAGARRRRDEDDEAQGA